MALVMSPFSRLPALGKSSAQAGQIQGAARQRLEWG